MNWRVHEPRCDSLSMGKTGGKPPLENFSSEKQQFNSHGGQRHIKYAFDQRLAFGHRGVRAKPPADGESGGERDDPAPTQFQPALTQRPISATIENVRAIKTLCIFVRTRSKPITRFNIGIKEEADANLDEAAPESRAHH